MPELIDAPGLAACEPIVQRHFERSPDPAAARSLLARIATGVCRRAPRRADKPLVLYGAGNLGRMARDWCERVGLPIALVIDARANDVQADPAWRGVRVRAPEAVSERERRDGMLAVCVANDAYGPIEASLLAQGWRDVLPFYDLAEAFRDRHPLSNGWFAGPLSPADVEGIGDLLGGWQDDVSRAHHLQFVAWRSLREEWSFDDAPVVPGDRFFIRALLPALGDHERFLDVGAHHGEVCLRFIAQMRGRLDSLEAIEPDPANRAVMLRALAAVPAHLRERVGVLPIAVGEQSRRQRFAGGLGYASQLSAIGADDVTVYAIDDLGLAPSFIKMHLEGHEGPALRGARQTLLSQRPVLAATVYHNREGLFATAQWLMRTLPRYRFWFRTHSWCGTGAVVYGVPQERLTGRPADRMAGA